MHILYFHQYYSTPKGASGVRSYQMAKQLVNHGHTVTMVCGSYEMGDTGLRGDFKNGRREGNVDGIQVIELYLPYSNKDRFLKRIYTFIRFVLRSIRIVLFQSYDLIFTTSTPLTIALPGILAKLIRFKPFIFEVRDLWPELPREMGVIKNPLILKAMSILEWLSYHAADACIALSPGIVEGINRRGINKNRIAMIPNGCSIDMDVSSAEQYCLPDQIHKNDFITVFTGAHGIANGLDSVLDTANVLIKRNKIDIKFLFVGDGKLKKHLKDRANFEKLDNCIFMDPVPRPKLANILKRADLGLMILSNVPAFYYGTSPNKFFDYISIGLPVLNNYPGWLAEMIQKYNCGVVVPPDNPEAFADKLEYLASNRDKLKLMGENAYKLARQKFLWEILSEQFVDFLEKVGDHKTLPTNAAAQQMVVPMPSQQTS